MKSYFWHTRNLKHYWNNKHYYCDWLSIQLANQWKNILKKSLYSFHKNEINISHSNIKCAQTFSFQIFSIYKNLLRLFDHIINHTIYKEIHFFYIIPIYIKPLQYNSKICMKCILKKIKVMCRTDLIFLIYHKNFDSWFFNFICI